MARTSTGAATKQSTEGNYGDDSEILGEAVSAAETLTYGANLRQPLTGRGYGEGPPR